ncbi:MAG: GNAT family N-acetyltransferase [Chitinophagaceae bacterium]|nr:GNAT family N-acetyltransferase [Chitinophagaceae bacterium]
MKPKVEIYKAGIKAIPLIQQLTAEVWPQTYAAVLTEEQIAYMLNMMYSEEALMQQMQTGHQFIIADVSGEPVGFASYSPTEKENEFKLHKLYVITTVQKTGTGKALLWYVMDEVRQFGGNHLVLQVNRQNENAIHFYERMGLKKETEADFDIGNGFYMNDYVMGIFL